MTLERSFRNLETHLQALGDSLRALRLTIVEDRPPSDDAALADLFGDAVEETLGWLEEVSSIVRELDGSTGQVGQAWRVLTACQTSFDRLERRCADLLSYRRIAELVQLGRRRGGEWHAWAGCVQDGLERLQPLLVEVRRAMGDCWQEIGERAGLQSVSIHNTNTGQQTAIVTNDTPRPDQP